MAVALRSNIGIGMGLRILELASRRSRKLQETGNIKSLLMIRHNMTRNPQEVQVNY